MGDVAASGGYYIAAKGGMIMSDPSTITGSIGVFGLHFNYEELAKKVNLGTDGVKTNRYADLLEMHRAATPEELAIVQTMVDGVYEDFLKIVADGRKMTRDSVHEIAQGRVWLGKDAQGIKLVDKFGGLRDAIKEAATLAKLTQAEWIQVPALHSGRETLLQKLLSDGQDESPLFAKTSGERDLALQFLLAAEVGAAAAVVSEAALIYMAPMRNLALSLGTIALQAVLTVIGMHVDNGFNLTPFDRASSAAGALLVTLCISSLIKSQLLRRLLGHPVSNLRWSLLLAIIPAGAVGWAAGAVLPEWAEIGLGIPAILATYCWVIWTWGFGPEDRLLLRRDSGTTDTMEGRG